MAMQKNYVFSACVSLLVLLLVASSVGSSLTFAHDPPWTFVTHAYLSVSPDPVGVNQQVQVTIWLTEWPPTARGNTGDRWQNFTVTITTPNGAKEVWGPYEADSAGSTYFLYSPNQTGTYTFQLTFPGQTLAGDNPPLEPGTEVFVGDYYLPSTSDEVQLTVQREPISMLPGIPLPDGYWSRPINGENHLWGQISGNWLAGTAVTYRFNPYSKAPTTAHIVWVKQLTAGGIVGGQYGNTPYYDAQSYEKFWGPPIILNGVLYYNTPVPPLYGFYAVDLRSGQQLWWHNSTGDLQADLAASYGSSVNYPQLSFGQLYDFESPNQHGVLPPYLWCVTKEKWYMHDANTGNWILTIGNVPFGAPATAQDGSKLIYVLDSDAGWLALWNSSKAIPTPSRPDYPYNWTMTNGYWSWRLPIGATLDGDNGYSWNVTTAKIPDLTIIRVLNDRLFATSETKLCTISLKPEETGKVLWQVDRAPIIGNLTEGVGPIDEDAGVFTMWVKETMQWYGYDLDTGEQLWGPTEPQTAWDSYSMGGAVAYGKLFSYGYGGILYAYDIKTGDLTWTYGPFSGGFDLPYGQYPFFLGAIADNKIFVYSTEHSSTKPLWRGAKLRCVDLDTGNEVWSVLFWANAPAIADGYLVTANSYDNQIYCFGKGQTAVTVTAPQTVVPVGSSVLIQGTVTDQSPGQKDVPAVSDANMTAWMEHLHMQQPIAGDVEGVPVELFAIGPDGRKVSIGTVISDSAGLFTTLWTPPSEGAYKVVANFTGTESFWGSSAETALGVASDASPLSGSDWSLLGLPVGAWVIGTAILVVVIVFGALTFRRLNGLAKQ
ncbi:MAG: PQQ-binding-like beta-propeller repeat protein [Candidatus Bathyarchaeota archaeon]|nr:PQQ-binding-like beta-propeller repeat protein [Candidatus Bathyarchaeota archaeon]